MIRLLSAYPTVGSCPGLLLSSSSRPQRALLNTASYPLIPFKIALRSGSTFGFPHRWVHILPLPVSLDDCCFEVDNRRGGWRRGITHNVDKRWVRRVMVGSHPLCDNRSHRKNDLIQSTREQSNLMDRHIFICRGILSDRISSKSLPCRVFFFPTLMDFAASTKLPYSTGNSHDKRPNGL